MGNINNSFVLDACIFPNNLFTSGRFTGCAEDIKKSKLDGFFLTVPGVSFIGGVKSIAQTYNLADDDKEKLQVVREYKDILEAKENGKKAIILYFQDPHPLENKIEFLRAFYELGIRAIQFSYNKGSYLGSGSLESSKYGLTDFGKEIIKEMNKLGMLIDLSHCGENTAKDVFKASEKPVTFCHANVYEICNNPRNKSNEQLKLLAESGGVIGLTPWSPVLWNGKKNVPPTIEDYLDHVDYVVKLIGIDYVGFASDSNLDHDEDLEGISTQGNLYPEVVQAYNTNVGTNPNERQAIGFSGALDIDNLIDHMKKRGYSDDDIVKFLGGNFLRVLKEVWK